MGGAWQAVVLLPLQLLLLRERAFVVPYAAVLAEGCCTLAA